jgi:hypothetical protein
MKYQLGTIVMLIMAACAQGERPQPNVARLLSLRKIWDAGDYHMNTDILRFRDRWLVVFREADGHVPGLNGKVRIITSADGDKWETLALVEERGIDLRDPKLSIMPDGRLLLLMGGSVYAGQEVPRRERKLIEFQARVAFSSDGREWTTPRLVVQKNEWLWRLTWHKGTAYGVAYPDDRKLKTTAVRLYRTRDALEYDVVTTLDDPGQLDEATVRFLKDDTMVMLARRDREDRKAWIGHSRRPYKDWTWFKTAHENGGPDFIVLPDGRMFAGGRRQVGRIKNCREDFARMGLDFYEPVLDFPGGHDCGYPGFAWHDKVLWMTYYSADGGYKANVYLARIKVDP